jgi:hypothetical protein
MARKSYSEDEVVLCTYIARFGRGFFNEKRIGRLQNRSESSIKMKVQNIAAMLNEEGYEHNSEVSMLSGLTTGEQGRKTNWDVVSTLVNLTKVELKDKCKVILLS